MSVSNKLVIVLLVFSLIVALSGTWVVLSNVSPGFGSSITTFIFSSPNTGYATAVNAKVVLNVVPSEGEINETK